MLLLELNPAQLGCRLVNENTVGGEELFPHAYGAISHAALLQIYRFDSEDRRRLSAGEAAQESGPDSVSLTSADPISDTILKQWLTVYVV